MMKLKAGTQHEDEMDRYDVHHFHKLIKSVACVSFAGVRAGKMYLPMRVLGMLLDVSGSTFNICDRFNTTGEVTNKFTSATAFILATEIDGLVLFLREAFATYDLCGATIIVVSFGSGARRVSKLVIPCDATEAEVLSLLISFIGGLVKDVTSQHTGGSTNLAAGLTCLADEMEAVSPGAGTDAPVTIAVATDGCPDNCAAAKLVMRARFGSANLVVAAAGSLMVQSADSAASEFQECDAGFVRELLAIPRGRAAYFAACRTYAEGYAALRAFFAALAATAGAQLPSEVKWAVTLDPPPRSAPRAGRPDPDRGQRRTQPRHVRPRARRREVEPGSRFRGVEALRQRPPGLRCAEAQGRGRGRRHRGRGR